jgi:hypothetical protein
MCIHITRQRLGKHIPARANPRKNMMSIARRRISKHASLIIVAVFSVGSVQSGYEEVFGRTEEWSSRVSKRQPARIWAWEQRNWIESSLRNWKLQELGCGSKVNSTTHTVAIFIFSLSLSTCPHHRGWKLGADGNAIEAVGKRRQSST